MNPEDQASIYQLIDMEMNGPCRTSLSLPPPLLNYQWSQGQEGILNWKLIKKKNSLSTAHFYQTAQHVLIGSK